MPRSRYDISPLIPLLEEGFTLLTPNFRLARHIKSEWDARQAASGAVAWHPVPALPLEQWLQQQYLVATALEFTPALTQLNDNQGLELWHQVIERDELDSRQYHLLRPAGAAEVASQARNTLLLWQVDTRSADIRQNFNLDSDCGTFLRWLDLFERRLAQAGQGTALDCIRALARCATQLPRSRVVLLAFDDVPPLYRATVRALCDELREISPTGECARRRLYSFADGRAELQAVAHWAAHMHRVDPDASIGIVLSDMNTERVALEYLLRREFDCLDENYSSLPVNFSTGIALAQAPLVRDALAALALAGPRIKVPALVALMQSRFLRLPDAESELANYFVNRLFDRGSEELSGADLRQAANEVKLGDSRGLVLGAYLLAIAGMRELRTPALPSQWIERFSKVLEVWGWPGPGPLDSLEFQQLDLWYRTLDELRGYDAVCERMAMPQALRLLRGICERKISQPQTGDHSIQVLGPLEAAGLAFDQLWLCGMQASRWPAAARPNPFIPQSLQRQLQMPHASAEREWTFAEGLLKQYASAASALHASYCHLQDDVAELPSALVAGFELAQLPLSAPINPLWTAGREERQLEYIDDDRAPAVDPEELATIGGGSALLEDQSQCPFRAFARRRLRVEPCSEFSLALSAGERGSLLHHVLNALWGHIDGHSSLLALTEAEEEARVAEAVQAAILAFPAARRRVLGAAYWRLEAQRLSSLLREWLAVEKLRADFVVSQRELDVSLPLGQLQLRLRVDRIDKLADGSLMIIDYKSGRSKVQDWLGERPAKPQLLLYGIAAPGAASVLAFAQLRPRDSKFVGLGSVAAAPGIGTDIARLAQERMQATDWESLNQCWQANLERLAAEFVAGAARVDPLATSSCSWCGLQPLCRVGAIEEEPE